jgi:hypothetical protein
MINVLDRRIQFLKSPWQQGRLLMTNSVMRYMSKEQRDEVDEIEHCMAFAFFTQKDDGRSRQIIFRFPSPNECQVAVAKHNQSLLERDILSKTRKIGPPMGYMLALSLNMRAREFVLQDLQYGMKRKALWIIHRYFTKAQIRKIIRGHR